MTRVLLSSARYILLDSLSRIFCQTFVYSSPIYLLLKLMSIKPPQLPFPSLLFICLISVCNLPAPILVHKSFLLFSFRSSGVLRNSEGLAFLQRITGFITVSKCLILPFTNVVYLLSTSLEVKFCFFLFSVFYIHLLPLCR